VFFITVPFAVVLIVAILLVVPNSADSEHQPIDYAGAGLSVVALVGVVFAIIEGPEVGWFAPLTLAAFSVGVIAAVGFVQWELRQDHPLLDPRLFLIRRFGLGSLTITIAFLAMFGMFFLLTLYLQFVLGYSPLGAAVRLLPFPAILIALAPRNPLLTARFGTRSVVAIGFTIQSAGFAAASLLTTTSPYWFVLCAVCPMAIGMALLMPPSTNAIMGSLPRDKAGVASAVNDTTREVGGAVGIAVLGSLLATGYTDKLGTAADFLPEPLAELAQDSIGGAMIAAQSAGEEAAGLIVASQQAYVDAVGLPFLVAAALGLAMAILIWQTYPDDEPHIAP
jgi:predicted MFS family arabinose efflux permease